MVSFDVLLRCVNISLELHLIEVLNEPILTYVLAEMSFHPVLEASPDLNLSGRTLA